jgi:16S rRNA C967 or C1407 C5-methylase (RsmB/RsmF family)
MTQLHVPVLAAELIDVLDPQPGAVAVDCTFGAGGHARLVAERIGPQGELVCVDRDPHAAEEYAAFAAEAPCATRLERGRCTRPPTARSSGSRPSVSAKWPRWLVPSCSSNPSSVT